MTQTTKRYSPPESRALSALALMAVNPVTGALTTAALAGYGHLAAASALGGAVIAATMTLATLRALDLIMDVDTTAIMSGDDTVTIELYLSYRRHLLSITLIATAIGALIGILAYIA